MFHKVFAATALLVASILPSALAAECLVVGHLSDNSIGAGLGGTTYTGGQGIEVFKDGEYVGKYEQGMHDPGVCADFIDFRVDAVHNSIQWGASCSNGNFNECHGAYGGLTHIEGEDVENEHNFYGIGISSRSQCAMRFEC